MLFVHGVRADRRQWAPQIENLSKEYRVISMDLPGHGVLARVPYTLERAADEISRVIDEAAGGRALVVGFSFGGYSAMELVSRHPENVSGLVLTGCSVNPHPMLALSYGLTASAHRLAGRSPAARSIGRLFQRVFPRRASYAIARRFAKLKRTPSGTAELLGIDFAAKLREYPGPVLFINGEDDLPFRAGEDEFLTAAANGQLVVIARAGHTANLERPEAVTEALREFASSVMA